MSDELTRDERLKAVARHGSGDFERALALLTLYDEGGRRDELLEVAADAYDDTGDTKRGAMS